MYSLVCAAYFQIAITVFFAEVSQRLRTLVIDAFSPFFLVFHRFLQLRLLSLAEHLCTHCTKCLFVLNTLLIDSSEPTLNALYCVCAYVRSCFCVCVGLFHSFPDVNSAY